MDTTASVSGTGINEFIVPDGGNREGREAVSPILVIEQAVPALVTGPDLLDRFQFMIRSKAGSALDTWITDSASSLLASFARRISADKQVVVAAIV